MRPYFCEWFEKRTVAGAKHYWSEQLNTTLCLAVGCGDLHRWIDESGQCADCSAICFIKDLDDYTGCGCHICQVAVRTAQTDEDALTVAGSDEYRRLLQQKAGVPLPPTQIQLGRGPESPVEVLLHDAMTRLGIAFVNQHPVERYRLDFAIVDRKIAIEVDGHYFHQRTKEQVQNDKRRDRRLLFLGWRVMRFTGSEVFNNAAGCAQEIARFLESAE